MEKQDDYVMAEDSNGNLIDFEAVVNLMDDEVRENLCSGGKFDDNPQGFVEAYAEAHEEKFRQPSAPMDGGAW